MKDRGLTVIKSGAVTADEDPGSCDEALGVVYGTGYAWDGGGDASWQGLA
jgi:hypothetical protein